MTTKGKKPAKARPGNHVTESTETLVVRIPKTVKRALEEEAFAGDTDVASLVREDLARGLKRRGYKLEAETAAACGLG